MGTFKQHLLDIGENRGDAWGNDVALCIAGVSDHLAVDAQYHDRCYNKYRKPVVKSDNSIPLMSNQALSSVVNEMFRNRDQTWTVSEIYDLYQNCQGQFTKQMLANLVTSAMNQLYYDLSVVQIL